MWQVIVTNKAFSTARGDGALPLQPRVNKQTGVDLLGKLKVFFFFFFTQNLLPVAALCEDFKLMKVAPFKALEKKCWRKRNQFHSP